MKTDELKEMVKEVLSEKFENFVFELKNKLKNTEKTLTKNDNATSKVIINILEKLNIIKTRKNKKQARAIITLFLMTTTGFMIYKFYKNYEKIQKANNFEEKLTEYLKGLELYKLKENKIIKFILNETKRILSENL